MKKVIGIATAAVFFLLPSLPISAAPVCGDRETVLSSLAEKYDEHPVEVGVTSQGGIIELLVSKDGATWTLLFSHPTGPACLVASGEAWQALPAQDKGPGA